MTVPSTALTSRDASQMVPSLGNLDAYIRAVQNFPMLEAEQEQALARQLRDKQDVQAASQLVLSHLRLVVAISRQYMGYGLPQGDLIQEGNVGLMKAVKRFDPDKGVRLVSYAMHWIKAEIHDYILKNFRMVKVATTKAQRKLFFNLRSLKHRYKGDAADVDSAAYMAGGTHDVLSEADVHRMAKELNVRPEDVIEMETRLKGGDIALESSADDDGESFAPAAYLRDDTQEPSQVLESQHRDWLSHQGVAAALDSLDARSRHIVQARWLDVSDNGSGGTTLHDLAAEYGVSAERIRQIETQALKKMRLSLEAA